MEPFWWRRRVQWAASVAVGMSFLASTASGSGPVVGWGSDASGESIPPDAVRGAAGAATAIAAGQGHACAIQSGSDAVVCWGSDYFGQSMPPDSVSGAKPAVTVGGWLLRPGSLRTKRSGRDAKPVALATRGVPPDGIRGLVNFADPRAIVNPEIEIGL
jgi:hypothetical protein